MLNSLKTLLCSGLMFTLSPALAHDPATGRATAILNEGVIVEQGDVKLLFDPIYDSGFETFPDMGPDLKAAVINGMPPYDDVDAVLVSHFHEDHFSVSGVLELLRVQPDVKLFAPLQAVTAMREHDGWSENLSQRVTAIALENGAEPARFTFDETHVEAVRTPHIGWPNDHATVENITYRAALPKGVRVMHMGDADKAPTNFEPHKEFFSLQRTHMGFVPFWFFADDEGRALLGDVLNIEHAVGIHVPIDPPDFLTASGADYFSVLGEERLIEIGSAPEH